MTKKVTVLDYGSGNIHSACKALAQAGAEVILTADPNIIYESDGLVVPGVGAFGSVMNKLVAKSANRLIDKRLTATRPVLGICVGMQVMFEKGLEHGEETEGLGQWPGTVQLLDSPRLPNIGWSKVQPDSGSALFQSIEEEHFYFVHSYAVTSWELDIRPPFIPAHLAWAEHGQRFLAAVENGPLVATQFHPEKSGEAGLKLLSNWIKSL
ncbi:MAG: imidazole glycerol phosphate synthase subunit HisH [Aquiluna sp.]|nr:imidazole glycerol phosphate synthase subunit HisH [Aquiluna sp.]